MERKIVNVRRGEELLQEIQRGREGCKDKESQNNDAGERLCDVVFAVGRHWANMYSPLPCGS